MNEFFYLVLQQRDEVIFFFTVNIMPCSYCFIFKLKMLVYISSFCDMRILAFGLNTLF